jgi:hypothetical protein
MPGGGVLANAAIAIGLYFVFREIDPLKALNPWFRAFVIGLTYLALIRVKFTTFSYQGRDVPFGIEALYEAAKKFVFKRINGIARKARYEETIALATASTLAELTRRARLCIEQDALLSQEEKRSHKIWLLKAIADPESSDEDKRTALADYVLSGHRSSDVEIPI